MVGARKLTPATPTEEWRRKVVDLEDDDDAALVDVEDALDAEKSRGAGTWRPARKAAMTSQKLRPFHQAWRPTLL
jgi:hypothetical protein